MRTTPRVNNAFEFFPHFVAGPLIPVERDAFFLDKIETAEIVNPVDMIGMGMSVKNSIDPRNPRPQSLSPEVRGGIEQETFSMDLQPGRSPESFIFGISGLTDRAAAMNQRYAS